MTASGDSASPRVRWRRVLLGGVGAFLLMLIVVQVRDLIVMQDRPSITSDLDGTCRRLGRIRSAGGYPVGEWIAGGMSDAGLVKGDLITGINGIALRDRPEALFRAYLRAAPGDSLRFTWLRAGVAMSGAVRIPHSTQSSPRGLFTVQRNRVQVDMSSAVFVASNFLSAVFLPLLLLITGLLLGFLRTAHGTAFQIALCCLGYGVMWIGGKGMWLGDKPQAFLVLLLCLGAGASLLPYLWLWVLARWPNATRLGRAFLRWSAPVAGLLVLRCLIYVADALAKAVGSTSPAIIMARRAGGILDYSDYPMVVLIIALLVAQRRETRGQPERRLVFLETAFLAAALAVLWDLLDPASWAWGLWHPTSSLAKYALSGLQQGVPLVLLMLWPLAFAYSVLAGRLFDIRFIVRRGLQYLLLSRTVLVVEALVLFLVLLAVLRSALPPPGRQSLALAGVAGAAAVGFVAGSARINRRLMGPLDRRFFRVRYDARRTLLDLADRVASLHDPAQILSETGAAVGTALHPWRAAFYLVSAEDETPRLTWAGTAPDGQPADDSLVANALRRVNARQGWLDLPGPDGQSRPAPASAPYELLVPVRGGEGMLGCLALAGKRSEEPYSREDKELLQVVSLQLGLALENARLLEIARREAAQARELGIAQHIQESLFPGELPKVPGWQFAAACRPAREVGGDYYDLFARDDGLVVLALGDVAGKGVGPALVMASVRAAIRSRLRRGAVDLGGLMEELNADLLESTPSEIFITLFVGILDPRQGDLRYVNAGHPPPVLIAGPDAAATRPASEGAILGAVPDRLFTEGRIGLPADSLLVLFSDGLSEAFDEQDEMYEEDRAVEESRALAREPAAAVLASLFDSVDRFRGRAEQSDDISILVVRRGDA